MIVIKRSENYILLYILLTEFPPIVHALIGMSRQSHDLFAFSRHGLAFVTSQDGGTTWYSVDPGVMAKAVRSTDFLHANSV